jgi:hypothetical protein
LTKKKKNELFSFRFINIIISNIKWRYISQSTYFKSTNSWNSSKINESFKTRKCFIKFFILNQFYFIRCCAIAYVVVVLVSSNSSFRNDVSSFLFLLVHVLFLFSFRQQQQQQKLCVCVCVSL